MPSAVLHDMLTDVKATWQIGDSKEVFDANFDEFTRLFDQVVVGAKRKSQIWQKMVTDDHKSVVCHRDRLLKKMRRQTKEITKLQAERDFFEGQFHATLDAQADAEDDWSDATDKLAHDNSDLIKELKKLKDLNVTKNNEIKALKLSLTRQDEEEEKYDKQLEDAREKIGALEYDIVDLQDEIGVYKDEQDEHIDELFDILDVDDIDDIVPAVKALKAKNEYYDKFLIKMCDEDETMEWCEWTNFVEKFSGGREDGKKLFGFESDDDSDSD
jgi:chromosome segregation ATPase